LVARLVTVTRPYQLALAAASSWFVCRVRGQETGMDEEEEEEEEERILVEDLRRRRRREV